MKNFFKLLYVYEERIPIPLRNLVETQIKKRNFFYKKMTYKSKIEVQKKLFRWADAVFFAPGRYINDDVFESSASNLKIFQLWSSGYDKFNIKGARKFNIPVANNGSQNSISVAEQTVLLMLAVNRKLPHFHSRASSGNWKNNSHGFDLHEMFNKNLGILG